VTRERALAQAHRANQELLAGKDRGPLHGIPYGAKDLLATKGIPTTWGAEPLRNQVFDFDATVVRRLEEAGAVLVAKLAMVELAGGLGYRNPDASFTGPGRTPWNPAHWSGGSSSGSAAAVAAGLVPFAIGSETSGSILTPAAFCGVAGLRPTYGLVSRHGAMALCWTLDKLGPLARSADDCGLVLSVIAGPDPQDPSTGEVFRYRERPARGRPGHRFKVGVLRNATVGTDPDVHAHFERALSALRDVADIEADVPFPDLPYREAVGVIVDAEGAAAFRDLIESGKVKQLRDAADRVGGYAMMMTRAADYVDALRARVAMRAQLHALLSRYDALLAPTRTRVAPPIGRDFDATSPGTPPAPDAARHPATIPAGNLAGLPAIAVPMGFAEDRLPTSLQLIGRAFSEETLLALAVAYQEMTDWHRQRP
jgi:aspartyl-tRNA(Asn)/glutamyl-tRNA(Gln) amidotransferase subunit A